MAKCISIALLVVWFVYLVDTATVEDVERAIDLHRTTVRLGALGRLLQEEFEALSIAKSYAEKSCILREGSPGLGQIAVVIGQVEEELRREAAALSAEQLATFSQAQVEEYAGKAFQLRINDLLEGLIELISSCTSKTLFP